MLSLLILCEDRSLLPRWPSKFYRSAAELDNKIIELIELKLNTKRLYFKAMDQVEKMKRMEEEFTTNDWK